MASRTFFSASDSVFPWLIASGISTHRAANHPESGSFTRLTVKVRFSDIDTYRLNSQYKLSPFSAGRAPSCLGSKTPMPGLPNPTNLLWRRWTHHHVGRLSRVSWGPRNCSSIEYPGCEPRRARDSTCNRIRVNSIRMVGNISGSCGLGLSSPIPFLQLSNR